MTSSISLYVSTVSGWLCKHIIIQEISDFISFQVQQGTSAVTVATARYTCSDCSHSSSNSFSQTKYITDIKFSSAEYETGDQGTGSFQPTLQSENLALRTS
jgi:hypothetical protein